MGPVRGAASGSKPEADVLDYGRLCAYIGENDAGDNERLSLFLVFPAELPDRK